MNDSYQDTGTLSEDSESVLVARLLSKLCSSIASLKDLVLIVGFSGAALLLHTLDKTNLHSDTQKLIVGGAILLLLVSIAYAIFVAIAGLPVTSQDRRSREATRENVKVDRNLRNENG